MLDRFPPCNPEHGKSMAKVQQTAGKEHGKDMVILPCSPLFVLLPVRREPMSVQLCQCVEGVRRKRKGHSGALRGYCPLTQSPGQQAEPNDVLCTAKPIARDAEEMVRTIYTTTVRYATPDHQMGISSTGALVENAPSLSISSGLSPLHSRM